MSLRQILKRADWREKTSQQCRDGFSATVETGRDSTPYTLAGLRDVLFQRGLRVDLLIGLRQRLAGLPVLGNDLEGDLLSGGVDFSIDALRFQFSQIRPAVDADSQEVIDAMLSIGVQTAMLWQHEQLPSLPTIEEIEAERAIIAAEDAGIVYDQRSVLMSMNINGPARMSLVVRSFAMVNGTKVDGPVVATITSADVATDAKLSGADKVLADALVSLVSTFAAGV